MASLQKASSSAIRILFPSMAPPLDPGKAGWRVLPPAQRLSRLRVYHLENIRPEFDRLLLDLTDQVENFLLKSREGGAEEDPPLLSITTAPCGPSRPFQNPCPFLARRRLQTEVAHQGSEIPGRMATADARFFRALIDSPESVGMFRNHGR